jgi:hypothetical protein
VPDPLLDIRDDLACIGLVPAPIQVLGSEAELDDEVAGQIFRLDFTAFLPPKPDQRAFIIPHDDPGVRAADEVSAILPGYASQSLGFHNIITSQNDIID